MALCVVTGPVQAQDDASEELERAQNEKAFFSSQQKQLGDRQAVSEGDLELLQDQVAKQRRVVRESLSKLERINADMVTLKYQRGRAMREAYVSASGNDNLFYALVSSGSLSEFLRRGQYAIFMTDRKEDLVSALDEQIAGLDSERRDLVTKQNGLEADIKELTDRVALLRLQLDANEDNLAEASAREAYLASLTGFSGQNDRDFLKRNEPIGGRFAFAGGGWGHGLGMSQFGARGAAARGKDYRGILSHYYQGTTVQKRSSGISEDYLARVVTAEMGSGPAEAMKAQAIAARSYAYTHSYQSCQPDTQACAASSNQQARDAVRDTRDQMVTYRGRVVETYYHSTSGGWTENNENVWGGQPRPWLRGVPSPWETDSRYWYWETGSYSREQMQTILNSDPRGRTTIGRLDTIRITGRGVSGRVTSMEIRGSRGVKRVSGPTFQAVFNTYAPGSDLLYDTLFGFR